jgi:hypothetical protein
MNDLFYEIKRQCNTFNTGLEEFHNLIKLSYAQPSEPATESVLDLHLSTISDRLGMPRSVATESFRYYAERSVEVVVSVIKALFDFILNIFKNIGIFIARLFGFMKEHAVGAKGNANDCERYTKDIRGFLIDIEKFIGKDFRYSNFQTPTLFTDAQMLEYTASTTHDLGIIRDELRSNHRNYCSNIASLMAKYHDLAVKAKPIVASKSMSSFFKKELAKIVFGSERVEEFLSKQITNLKIVIKIIDTYNKNPLNDIAGLYANLAQQLLIASIETSKILGTRKGTYYESVALFDGKDQASLIKLLNGDINDLRKFGEEIKNSRFSISIKDADLKPISKRFGMVMESDEVMDLIKDHLDEYINKHSSINDIGTLLRDVESLNNQYAKATSDFKKSTIKLNEVLSASNIYNSSMTPGSKKSNGKVKETLIKDVNDYFIARYLKLLEVTNAAILEYYKCIGQVSGRNAAFVSLLSKQNKQYKEVLLRHVKNLSDIKSMRKAQ